jgi:hypothetical protein
MQRPHSKQTFSRLASRFLPFRNRHRHQANWPRIFGGRWLQFD